MTLGTQYSHNICLQFLDPSYTVCPKDYAYSPLFVLLCCSVFMMTSSNGNIFHVTGLLRGEFTGGFPSQRPVTRSVDLCHPHHSFILQSPKINFVWSDMSNTPQLESSWRWPLWSYRSPQDVSAGHGRCHGDNPWKFRWCDRLRDRNCFAFDKMYWKWKRVMGLALSCCL